MHFYIAALTAIAFCTRVSAAHRSFNNIERFGGTANGKHIVVLKPSASVPSFVQATNITATHQWNIINGFVAELSNEHLNLLRTHNDVESISEDGVAEPAATVQGDATWGLARMSSDDRLVNQCTVDLNFAYAYNASATGLGVDIYVVDSGVYLDHADFGSRAKWGKTIAGSNLKDEYGHGTHCAGTAAGHRFGVAKEATIIAVKVIDDKGKVTFSDIISGLDWIIVEAGVSRRPSIASISIAGGRYSPLDEAVKQLTSNNIHVVVAAGNKNADAEKFSPGRAPSAITVGASTLADSRARYSNFGPAVDIFASGDNIISTSIRSPKSYSIMDGTSMATAHITGLVATLISSEGNISPGEMKAKVKNLALKNVLTGLPMGTVNELANNGMRIL